MKNLDDFGRALLKTWDGRSAISWALILFIFFVKSILIKGLVVEQFKYVGFLLVVFLIFSRFRVNDFDFQIKTNIWGVLNVNLFGFFLIYMELRYE